MKKLTVISCDPGTKNFACSVAQYTFSKGKLKVKVLGTCMIEDALQDLTKDVAPTLVNFKKVIKEIARKYQPRAACFERYQSRGLKGKTIEAIGYMLGTLALVFRNHDPQFILASTWKNRINAVFKEDDLINLKEVYKHYGLTRVASPKKEHELDAVLIGMYRAHKLFGLPDFDYFRHNDFDQFVKETFLEAPEIKL